MKNNPWAKEILREWLQAHGYDGLVREETCRCEADSLAPCEEMDPDLCYAAHKLPCGCFGVKGGETVDGYCSVEECEGGR